MEHFERRAERGVDPGQGVNRFAVLARSTLPEEIANRLLTLIREQELRPGDKLPPERSLARMMEVSRPVLREALRALSIMKVVDIRQGDGTYITSLEPKQLVSHLDFVFSKDSIALVQLLEARRVLEVGNVRLAADRVSGEQLTDLEDTLAELEAAIDDADRFSDLDIAFHNAICAAADNFLLAQFMNIIGTLGKVSRQRTGAIQAVREATLADHRRIVAALASHDADSAASAMRQHLDRVERALDSVIDGSADSPATADKGPVADAAPLAGAAGEVPQQSASGLR